MSVKFTYIYRTFKKAIINLYRLEFATFIIAYFCRHWSALTNQPPKLPFKTAYLLFEENYPKKPNKNPYGQINATVRANRPRGY